MKQITLILFALAVFAAHASVTLAVTRAPVLATFATPSTATPDAPNRVTGDVATFTPTPRPEGTRPTATPTAALGEGPQEIPTPIPWVVVARLFLPVVGK